MFLFPMGIKCSSGFKTKKMFPYLCRISIAMNIVKPPFWLRKLYYSLVWEGASSEKVIYLTFDDGPTPEVTHWVLQQLKDFNAQATFFCIGRNVDRHPEIYRQILDHGHAVGNHTYSHLNGWKSGLQEYIDDIELASQMVTSSLFRPPYGRIRRKQIQLLKKQGYKIFMWDVLAEDYNAALTPSQCLSNVTKNVQPGSIVVFHDSLKASKNLYPVLPAVLKHFSDKGYKFLALS